jgi:putative membrane protein
MISQFFVSVAAVIHIYIFLMESIWWGRPKTNRTFGVTDLQAEQNRLFAFNQGYYNLFLALASLLGVVLVFSNQLVVGSTLIVYSSFSMFGAALVLLYSKKNLIRAALIQGVPPLLGLICWWLKI